MIDTAAGWDTPLTQNGELSHEGMIPERGTRVSLEPSCRWSPRVVGALVSLEPWSCPVKWLRFVTAILAPHAIFGPRDPNAYPVGELEGQILHAP